METITTDVLVIGGGAAGLRAAIAAREAGTDVLLVSKTPVGYANCSAISNAGIAAAMGLRDPRDNPEAHVRDTIEGGRFINQRALVEALAERSPREIGEAQRLGIQFRTFEGAMFSSLTPGHSYPRAVSVAEGIGVGMTRPMREFALKIGVGFREGTLAYQLFQRDGRAVAALGVDKDGTPVLLQAKAIVLAGGGAGYAYARTNNPVAMTGDGYALAYRAGVSLIDMEFVQLYPTGLNEPGLPSVNVYYEGLVLRGGAVLRNSLGEDTLAKHGLLTDKQRTRDAMTRALSLEIAEGRGVQGGVVMDLGAVSADDLQRFARAIPKALASDATTTPKSFHVSPVVHYFMGGVKVNAQAETDLPGLFAGGEVAGGIHGANRLGGNALAETLVFGAIAGENAAQFALREPPITPMERDVQNGADRIEHVATQQRGESLNALREEARGIVWRSAGPIRTGHDLESGLLELSDMRRRLAGAAVPERADVVKALEIENIITTGETIIASALERTESRGAHFRLDYPHEDGAWLKNVLISCVGGAMQAVIQPVP